MTITKNCTLKFKQRNISETSLEWTDQHRSTINLMAYFPSMYSVRNTGKKHQQKGVQKTQDIFWSSTLKIKVWTVGKISKAFFFTAALSCLLLQSCFETRGKNSWSCLGFFFFAISTASIQNLLLLFTYRPISLSASPALYNFCTFLQDYTNLESLFYCFCWQHNSRQKYTNRELIVSVSFLQSALQEISLTLIP